MKLDLNKPATQIIIDLIWRSNGIWFEYDTLDFGLPKAIDNPPPWAANTVVEVSDNLMESERFTGSTKIAYRRLAFDELEPYTTGPIVLPPLPFQSVDLLPAINAAYRLQLEIGDIVNEMYQNLECPLTVMASDTALCYIGQLTPSVVGAALSAIIPNRDLDGFSPYEPA